ncbi:hypothetical protein [Burkholderia mallei]|uniref:hypothetical protein n=1 Tax=Burkholderia mallei TaxID=13373 RepID=UPI0023EF082B|nr:hypothetical protein [Burkholderia mallei]
MIALDPKTFLGDALDAGLARGERMFEAIVAQGARLPSQRRFDARARSAAHGVRIPARSTTRSSRCSTDGRAAPPEAARSRPQPPARAAARLGGWARPHTVYGRSAIADFHDAAAAVGYSSVL